MRLIAGKYGIIIIIIMIIQETGGPLYKGRAVHRKLKSHQFW